MRYATIAVLVAGVLAMIFPFRRASSTPEETFWKWFREHEKEIFDFEKDQEKVFDQLGKALARVDENLTFEFSTKLENGKREFVISAGGIKSAFPKVESLWSTAPKLERWTFIKFRPRRAEIHDVQFKTRTVKGSQIKYLFFKDQDPNKIGIVLLLPGYREKEREDFGQIGFLFLDQVLGEYDVEMRVGAVEFDALDSKYADRANPLSELAMHFDEQFQSQKK